MRPNANLLRSSSFRLALMYVALFSASVALLLAFIYWRTAGFMATQTDATIEAEVSGLAERYRLTGLEGLVSSIDDRLSRKPSGNSIYLLTDNRFNPLIGNLDRWPKVEPDADGWLDFQLEAEHNDEGRQHRARARPFRLAGGFHLLVGRDMQELRETERLIVRALAWGFGITVVLALGGGLMMSRTTLRRIEAINETSRRIMRGDLAQRIPNRGTDDDFDQLADNLNSMLERIEQLMEDVRRVSDSIAHDLRTPLTRLRSHLENIGQRAADGTAGDVEQALAEADGLLVTFNALLRIAHIESGSRKAAFTDVDLGTVLRDVTELYEPLAEDKEQTLTVDIEEGITVHADRDMLFQALANLLDNAVKYTPEGKPIDVELRRTEAGGAITVTDSGPGIPESERERVFQRFVRLDESRNTPGNGLGLSLVAAVARLHRASVTLGGASDGLSVRLEIPITAR